MTKYACNKLAVSVHLRDITQIYRRYLHKC